jgi:hypothetical protein
LFYLIEQLSFFFLAQFLALLPLLGNEFIISCRIQLPEGRLQITLVLCV